MQLHFYKYHGTGNDFIILDNRENKLTFSKEQVAHLCHRHFGIGADGLMLLNKNPKYDFEMIYYNADGGEGSLCGNGARCMVRFAKAMGINKYDFRFLAADGEHEANLQSNGHVALKMNEVKTIKSDDNKHILNTGSPHYVEILPDVLGMDVCERGRSIRYSDEFRKKGINVNFVQLTDEPDRIIVRTYERGVENETYSCGTGVTAAALVCYHNENGFNCVTVETKGGTLSVEFDRTKKAFKNIWLVGPAEKVFEGEIEV